MTACAEVSIVCKNAQDEAFDNEKKLDKLNIWDHN